MKEDERIVDMMLTHLETAINEAKRKAEEAKDVYDAAHALLSKAEILHVTLKKARQTLLDLLAAVNGELVDPDF